MAGENGVHMDIPITITAKSMPVPHITSPQQRYAASHQQQHFDVGQDEQTGLVEMDNEMYESAQQEVAESAAHPRGNYPGWTSMLSMDETYTTQPHQQQQPMEDEESEFQLLDGSSEADLEAALLETVSSAELEEFDNHHSSHRHHKSGSRKRGIHRATHKTIPKASKDVKHIYMNKKASLRRIKDANIGINKVHVHMYGKEDAAAASSSITDDRARRLKGVVSRLAQNNKESYNKISKLLKKLQKCKSESKANRKNCRERITEKMMDWKAEWKTNTP